MKPDNLERFLLWAQEPVINHMGEEGYTALCEEARGQLVALEPGAPRFKNRINRLYFQHTLPGLAVYRALTDTLGQKREVALDLMHLMIEQVVHRQIESSRLLRFVLGHLGGSSLLAAMFARSMTSPKEARGWLCSRPARSEAYIAVDVHQCALMLYLSEQGAPELCTPFCDGDHISAQHMKGLRFQREQSIAKGDAICTFRYFKTS